MASADPVVRACRQGIWTRLRSGCYASKQRLVSSTVVAAWTSERSRPLSQRIWLSGRPALYMYVHRVPLWTSVHSAGSIVQLSMAVGRIIDNLTWLFV